MISTYALGCQYDTLLEIELNPSFVLPSDNTNYKNDIQLFLQLFDEHKVNRRLPLTLTGVMSEANSGMTIHTLVLSSGSFSCHCNSNSSHLSIGS